MKVDRMDKADMVDISLCVYNLEMDLWDPIEAEIINRADMVDKVEYVDKVDLVDNVDMCTC